MIKESDLRAVADDFTGMVKDEVTESITNRIPAGQSYDFYVGMIVSLEMSLNYVKDHTARLVVKMLAGRAAELALERTYMSWPEDLG